MARYQEKRVGYLGNYIWIYNQSQQAFYAMVIKGISEDFKLWQICRTETFVFTKESFLENMNQICSVEWGYPCCFCGFTLWVNTLPFPVREACASC